MKLLTAAICFVSAGILTGCVNSPSYRGSAVRDQSCGYGQDDITHPYAGRCDWRRENGRGWADSGGSVYRRGG